MKVILTSDIDNIGLAGEIKIVKNGLARNYLIPQKLAIEATDSNLRNWEKKLEDLKQEREKIISDARERAEQIEGTVVSIESKVSEGEKIFGSVNVQTIAEALKEQHGIEIERKNILLEKNLKSTGRFEVPVRVKAHIKATVTVEITAEEEEKDTAAKQAVEAETQDSAENPQQREEVEDSGQIAENPESPEEEPESAEEEIKTEETEAGENHDLTEEEKKED